MKKAIAVLLLTTLVGGMLCSCGKPAPQETPQPEVVEAEPVPEVSAVEPEIIEVEDLSAPEEPSVEHLDLEPLEQQLQGSIMDFVNTGAMGAVSVVDLMTGDDIAVNDIQMEAASVIKLFIAGAVYENIEDTSGLEGTISAMITVSDNTSANNLVNTLGNGDSTAGMAVVNAYCEEHGFKYTHMGRLLMASNDLDDNYTSVGDCAKFLEKVYNGDLDGSEHIVEYMLKQERTGKIPAGVHDGSMVANKTGELDDVENDAAIVYSARPYVICVMTENDMDTYGARQTIISMSGMVNDYFGVNGEN